MLWRFARRNPISASEKCHPWRRQVTIDRFSSDVSCSSSPNLPNYYNRRTRKSPFKSFATHWLQNFAYQLAENSFRKSLKETKNHLLRDLTAALSLYGIESSHRSHRLFVKILIRELPPNWREQLQKFLQCAENSEDSGLPESVVVDLIKLYGDNKMFHDAVSLFLGLPKYRCQPSLYILNALLAVLCRDDEIGITIVPSILTKSTEMKIKVDESSFGILIKALCRNGNANGSLEVLKSMAEEGFHVDQRLCSLTLATMCRRLSISSIDHSGSDNNLMEFLDDLKTLGFEPRSEDYRNTIRCLVEMGCHVDALDVLKQMMKVKGIGTIPADSCDLVFDALIRNGEFLMADNLFDEMLVLGHAVLSGKSGSSF